MKEWMRLCPEEPEFPTLRAEELLASLFERQTPEPGESVITPSVLPGLWQFTTPDGRVSLLIRTETLCRNLSRAVKGQDLSFAASMAFLPPAADAENVLVSVPAGAQMPGWRLGLILKDEHLLNSVTRQQTAIYLWTGILVVVLVGLLAGWGARVLRRQTALARLKNDLTATVSHELKTPVAVVIPW